LIRVEAEAVLLVGGPAAAGDSLARSLTPLVTEKPPELSM